MIPCIDHETTPNPAHATHSGALKIAYLQSTGVPRLGLHDNGGGVLSWGRVAHALCIISLAASPTNESFPSPPHRMHCQCRTTDSALLSPDPYGVTSGPCNTLLVSPRSFELWLHPDRQLWRQSMVSPSMAQLSSPPLSSLPFSPLLPSPFASSPSALLGVLTGGTTGCC